MTLLARLADILERDGRAVLVTVTDAVGSAPRDAGARMAVAENGSFTGTIGGGALEWEALRTAAALFDADAPRSRSERKSLGPDLAQCCGGRVTLVFEQLDRHDLRWIKALLGRPEALRVVVVEEGAGVGATRRLADEAEAAALGPGYRLTLPDGRALERFGESRMPLWLFGAGHVGRALALALA